MCSTACPLRRVRIRLARRSTAACRLVAAFDTPSRDASCRPVTPPDATMHSSAAALPAPSKDRSAASWSGSVRGADPAGIRMVR